MLLSAYIVMVPSVPPDDTPENSSSDPFVPLCDGDSPTVIHTLSCGSIASPYASVAFAEPKPFAVSGVPCGLNALTIPEWFEIHTLPWLSTPRPSGVLIAPPVTVRLRVQSFGACVRLVGNGGVEPIAANTPLTLLPGFFTMFISAAQVFVGALPPLGVAAVNSGEHPLVPSELMQDATASASA